MVPLPVLLARLGRAVSLVAALGALISPVTLAPSTARAEAQRVSVNAEPLALDDSDCGPPSTTIPGPPPNLIVVGQPMRSSWLLCYMKQDLEGQTFSFDRWGEVRETAFRGYPVECWNQEADPGWAGRRTPGIVAQMFGWNLDHTQYVRFTYRIQLDGDYINNCQQEILEAP